MEVTERDGSHHLPNAYGSRPFDACVYRAQSPGGGWGNPMERPADAVLRDIADGLVSAKRDYGGVVTADGSVDAAARARRPLADPALLQPGERGAISSRSEIGSITDCAPERNQPT